MKKHVVIIGTGMAGKALAEGFSRHGYSVSIASRTGKQIEGWNGNIGKTQDLVKNADLIILSTKGSAAETVVRSIASDIAGKTIIDTTNPLSDTPPTNGVLSFFTNLNESLMEKLQKIAPDAHFVKAFNSVGNAFMVDPDFDGIKPSMFICGNNESAKKEVGSILTEFGWEIEDMGMVEAARVIEPLCILWCIPGFLKNDWSHAFKILRK